MSGKDREFEISLTQKPGSAFCARITVLPDMTGIGATIPACLRDLAESVEAFAIRSVEELLDQQGTQPHD